MPRRTPGICVLLLLLSGCVGTPDAPGTQPAAADPVTADPGYWYEQPPTATVVAADFDRLWTAAEDTSRQMLFKIDRTDRRGGVLTTEPTVSSQIFEPWRQDLRTPADTAESTLATTRRTIRFEFTRRDDGQYEAAPKVLVERYSQSENRVSSVVLYRSAFRVGRTTDSTPYGTRETDRGVFLSPRYWYATGRDAALEKAVAAALQKRVGG